MTKKSVRVGQIYAAKVSGIISHVRIIGESPYGGWNAINIDTRRDVRIKTAGRLRHALPTV